MDKTETIESKQEETSDALYGKEKIKQCIKSCIKNEISLSEIHRQILNDLKEDSLNSIEENYINHKYIKYCLKEWYNQLPLILNQIKQNDIKALIHDVTKIKTMQDIPPLFSNSRYFKMIMDNVHLLLKHDSDLIIIQFKQNLADCLSEKFDNLEQCNEFSIEIVDQLKSFFSIYEIHKFANKKEITSMQYIKIFINGQSTLTSFAQQFVKNFQLKQLIGLQPLTDETINSLHRNLNKLKKTFGNFKETTDTVFIDSDVKQIRKIIDYSLTPVTFRIHNISGQNIILAQGVYIAFSYILLTLEKELTNSNSAEIWLMTSETLFIDCDLNNQLWHGKNMGICAKQILVIQKSTFDVSGWNGEPQNKLPKAQNGIQGQNEVDKNGSHGANGTKGESGGNITVITERIVHGENWIIKTDGGNGSFGQDGGDGADGENGSDGHGLTLQEFKRDFPSAARFWSPTAIETKKEIFNNIKKIVKEDLITEEWERNLYIEGKTEHGNKIYFSYYYSATTREAYCLYQGASGQPGKSGGFGGLGGYQGEPGLAGDIQIFTKSGTKANITTIARDGSRGSDGQPGRNGNSGKSGENKPDVGYIDYKWWTEPIYYGSSWLRLSTYNTAAPVRVRDSKFKDEKKYSGIENRQKPDPPACLSFNAEDKRIHENKKAKKQEATRKNAISNDLLTKLYNDHQTSFSIGSIANLQVDIDLSREQISRIEFKENQIQNAKICITKSFLNEKHMKLNKPSVKSQLKQSLPSNPLKIIQDLKQSCKKKSEEAMNILNSIHNQLKCETFSYKDMFNIVLEVEEIEKSFYKSKSDKHNALFHQLKSLAMEKLKYNFLEEIAKIIDTNQNVQLQIIDEFIEEETYSGCNSAIHSVLGSQNGCGIYEYIDCERVREKLKENISKIANDEQFKSIHQSIMYLIKNWTNKSQFTHIRKYVDDSNLNKQVLMEYSDYIVQNRQPFNKYDIALLAYLFNICLHVHEISDKDESLLTLFAVYNASSTNVQHVLYIHTQFIKLSTRKIENKKAKCVHYKQILKDIDQMKTSVELKNYFDNQHFRFRDNQENQNQDQIEGNGNQLINEICSYFSDNIKQHIRLALTTISPEFISNSTILKVLKKRFAIENPSIQHDIITLFSMAILKSNSNKENLTIYEWILSAYPQNEWINELALLKCEFFTNEPYEKISDWRLILRQIKSQQIIALLITKLNELTDNQEQFDIEKLLLQISSSDLRVEEFVDILTNLELNQWQLKLKHISFIQSVHDVVQINNQVSSNTEDNSLFDQNLSIMIYYLYALNNKSELLVNQFLQIIKRKQIKLEQLLSITSNFYCGIWEFDEENIKLIENNSYDQINSNKSYLLKIQNWFNWAKNNERKLEKLIQIINQDKNTTIKNELEHWKSFCEMANNSQTVEIRQTKKNIKRLSDIDIHDWVIEFKAKDAEAKVKHLPEALAVIEKAITIYCPGISSLRDAQKLTILSFISNYLNTKNLLAEVATGEGKSLIIATIMIIICLLGGKGDIVTSSPILAERDASANEKLYNSFGILVGHNSFENIDERRTAYQKQVVYGDVSRFQRDYLLDHFYGKKILGNRYEKGRSNIIVDEVDSMLLDKGNCVLYLSHQPPCLDTLESVYVFIWQMVVFSVAEGKHLSVAEINKAVLHNLYPILDKKELMKLTNKREIMDQIWNQLIANENIDDDGKILSSHIKFEDEDLQKFIKHVEYLLKEILNHEKQIEVPNYLKSFIEQHSKAWIQSAIKALEMEEGRNYILDVDRSATKLDKHPNIIIVDCHTGVDQTNSQWNEGLHQFLQLKHQCKTSLLSLKSVFISNISFFNMYEHIFGVSGTLGSESEREFLKSTYNVDFITVPVALPSKFKEDQPIICKNMQEWSQKIVEKSIEISKKRSVLIICETIKDVEQINHSFACHENFNTAVYIYKRSYEKFSIANEGLDPGKIIIATNLAGRGTDIKVTDQLNSNGGLHVILSYLPENYRIEQQAFGRTARKGQTGSGQLICVDQFACTIDNDNEFYSPLQVVDFKNERDYNELCRVGAIRHYYETFVQFEENLFNRYHKAYDKLKSKLAGDWKTNDAVKDIILNSVLNKWAFWLDSIGELIEKKNNNRKLQIFKLLETFINQLDNIMNENDSIQKLVTEPTQLIKLGKCYIKNKNYFRALEIMNKVIRDEPKFCQAAHYYKAHCIVKMTNLSKSQDKIDFHKSLNQAEILFNHHIDILTRQTTIINQLGETNKNQSLISFVKIDSYWKKNENMSNLYSNFIRSIHDIRGHRVTIGTLLSIDIDQELANEIYDKLIDPNKKILLQRQFNQNFNEDDLKTICIEYQLRYNDIKEYLSRINFINQEDVKNLVENLHMPTREQFWQLMVEKEIFTNVKHLILLVDEESNKENVKLQKFIQNFKLELKPIDEIKSKDKSTIFLRKIDWNAKTMKYACNFMEKINNDTDYKILEQQKIILLNTMATIDINKLHNRPIGKFESLKPDNLMQIKGLNEDNSKEIYNHLVEQKIIDKENGTLITRNFQKLKLGDNQVYDQGVISIINCQCLYRIQILEILDQIISKDFDDVILTLPYELHEQLLNNLECLLIIRPVVFNYEKKYVSWYRQFKTWSELDVIETLIKEVCSTNETIYKSVAKSLHSTIGKLVSLSTPDSYLNDVKQSLDANEKFEHIEELDIFTINGLDHTIDIEEKKWTWTMWASTAIIFIFGIAQIIGGVFLEFYSMGAGTFVAAGLISEGIHDIFYAISAARTGYFSWDHYFIHKIQSIIVTTAIMGIGALIAKGIRFSRFGTKLVGNTGNLAQLCGTKLLDAASKSGMPGVTNNLMKAVRDRILLKLTEGVAFGLSNAGISYLSDKFLKGYCGKITSELFKKIQISIEGHKNQIKESLTQIYKTHGKALTQKWLADVNQTINSDVWYSNVSQWIKQIVNIISGGISSALRKMNYANHSNQFTKMASRGLEVMKYSSYIAIMSKIYFQTKCFINDKIKKLQEKAKECEKNNESIQINPNEAELNEFIENETEQWTKTLENKIDTDVRKNLIEPILCECANTLLRKLGRSIREYHQRRKENALWNKFLKRKDEFDKEKQNQIKNNGEDLDTTSVPDEIKKKYTHDLLVLMAETKNPKLIARIVKEGGPMDMSCIQAASNILHRPIKLVNADGTTFPDLICPQGMDPNSIKDEDCIKLQFSPGDGINTFGHFIPFEANSETEINYNDNNCLIHALVQATGEDRDQNKFREQIANEIENDLGIRHIISNGYHRYYISQFGFGGQKPADVSEFKKIEFDEDFSNKYLIGTVGIHGNHASHGITCLSKNKQRESEHLIPSSLMQHWCKVRCVRDIIETSHPEVKGNPIKERELFEKLMTSNIPESKLEKFMMSPKEMFTICMPYAAHHDITKTWTSFKKNYEDNWVEAEKSLNAYKTPDDNQNHELLESCMKQYSHLFDDEKYPNMRQGFVKCLELYTEIGFINLNQMNELKSDFNLNDITNTNQVNQVPITHEHYDLINSVHSRSLSTNSLESRTKRHRSE